MAKTSQIGSTPVSPAQLPPRPVPHDSAPMSNVTAVVSAPPRQHQNSSSESPQPYRPHMLPVELLLNPDTDAKTAFTLGYQAGHKDGRQSMMMQTTAASAVAVQDGHKHTAKASKGRTANSHLKPGGSLDYSEGVLEVWEGIIGTNAVYTARHGTSQKTNNTSQPSMPHKAYVDTTMKKTSSPWTMPKALAAPVVRTKPRAVNDNSLPRSTALFGEDFRVARADILRLHGVFDEHTKMSRPGSNVSPPKPNACPSCAVPMPTKPFPRDTTELCFPCIVKLSLSESARLLPPYATKSVPAYRTELFPPYTSALFPLLAQARDRPGLLQAYKASGGFLKHEIAEIDNAVAAQKRASFLGLPKELREQIYAQLNLSTKVHDLTLSDANQKLREVSKRFTIKTRHVFVSGDAEAHAWCYPAGGADSNATRASDLVHVDMVTLSNLTQVCQKIHAEIEELLWTHSVLLLRLPPRSLPAHNAFWSMITHDLCLTKFKTVVVAFTQDRYYTNNGQVQVFNALSRILVTFMPRLKALEQLYIVLPEQQTKMTITTRWQERNAMYIWQEYVKVWENHLLALVSNDDWCIDSSQIGRSLQIVIGSTDSGFDEVLNFSWGLSKDDSDDGSFDSDDESSDSDDESSDSDDYDSDEEEDSDEDDFDLDGFRDAWKGMRVLEVLKAWLVQGKAILGALKRQKNAFLI